MKIKRLKTLVADAEIMDGLRIVVQKMGSVTGTLVAAVGPSGLAKGVKAGSIIRAAAQALGGGGGGRPKLAQGGGPNVEKLDEALAAGRETMRAG